MSFDIVARILTLVLHFIRFGYWIVSEKSAYRKKPLRKKRTFVDLLERAVTVSLGILIGLQLVGLSIWSFPNNFFSQMFGLLMVVLGIGISMNARIHLGANWAHAAEYQIKKKQTLVTSGIYGYIRHPIYTGMSLAYVGAEVVAGSWLFLPLIPLLMIVSLRQAVKEEAILSKKFGVKYTQYQRRSNRFIPYIY